MPFGKRGHEWQQAIAGIYRIDLVHHCHHRPAGLGRARQCQGILVTEAQCLDHEYHHIRIQGRCRSGAVHGAVQRPAFLPVQSRCIDESNLRIRQVHQTQHTVARGLRLGRDDGELLPRQRIEQRGLADIGPADQGRETAAMLRTRRTRRTRRSWRCRRVVAHRAHRCCNSCSTAAADSCSARRRLDATPGASSDAPSASRT